MSQPHFNPESQLPPTFPQNRPGMILQPPSHDIFFHPQYPRNAIPLRPEPRYALPPIRSLELNTPLIAPLMTRNMPSPVPPGDHPIYPIHRANLTPNPNTFIAAYSQDSYMPSRLQSVSADVHPLNPYALRAPQNAYEQSLYEQRVHTRHLPRPSPIEPIQAIEHQLIHPLHEEFAGSDAKKVSRKQRRKRQCPECLEYFINLSTHQAVHRNPSVLQVCEVCQRGFVRRNDLMRHRNKHWQESGATQGSFMCPFKTSKNGGACSHPTGAFSRCDTYKNHLKSIHFVCPPGTRKYARNRTYGTCGGCQKEFCGVDNWLNNHIEAKECIALDKKA